MGYFGKVSGAQVNGGGRYFPVGKHLVKLDKVKINDGHKGLFAIVECIVVETDNELLEANGHRQIKPGDKFAQVINMRQDMGPINVKAFVLAACGLEPTDNDEAAACTFLAGVLGEAGLTFEEVCNHVFDDETNLFEGVHLPLECIAIKTLAKKDFTKHLWGASDAVEHFAALAAT